jgi:UDP-N-acetylglucosamine 2-epimerase (non-hydrolysing)
MKTVACVVGARPNFMKVAPILRQIEASSGLDAWLIHTGQHYDNNLSGQFFRDLEIGAPEDDLGVGSGSHAVQTARVMTALDSLFDQRTPDVVLVVGDVNSTLAAALVASKRQIPVIHVEAGLRSFDRTMPEEINRILTDRVSDLLFVTEQSGVENLRDEGIAEDRVHLVGNVMIDSLFHARSRAIPAHETIARAGENDDPPERFALLTLHRPSNVDSPEVFGPLLDALNEISKSLPIVFPVHPRTRAALDRHGLTGADGEPGILMTEPVSYFEMVGLLHDAALVLTDSGGLQEESSALGIPCLTLRENTERPVTVSHGTNVVVGNTPDAVRAAFARFTAGDHATGSIPPLWDGRAAERIVRVIENWI